ncbi:unnamed protein product [Ectocarpus sp. 4 AP-2014]
MPGRKKGRQKGAAGSKAQSARRWNDAMRDAREDLGWDRRQNLGRGGDAAPPRLSATGFRSLATLLRQRVRADEIDAAAPSAVRSENLAGKVVAGPSNYFSVDWTETRPRKTCTLLSLCIKQIGRDFLAYRADDDAVAEAFLLLPSPCLSRLSRSASARGNVADHNIGLLCSPRVGTLWFRGRFTDKGAGALLPALNADDTPNGGSHAAELVEVYRDGTAGDCLAGNAVDTAMDTKSTVASGDDGLVASTQSAAYHAAAGEAVVEGAEEEWETACDRIEASLRGGVSLTSLDLSSPRVTAGFVKRLTARIPSLRRLGLRGSLGVVGGPDFVCDHVPRLAALRELDVSHCTWFCDLTLRRLAKSLSLRASPAMGDPENQGPHAGSATSLQDLDEAETRGWSAAFEPSTDSLAFAGHAGLGPSGSDADLVSGASRESGEKEPSSHGRSLHRFRTFTVVCARTAVTEKGAKAAELMSPGLMVVLAADKPAAAGGALSLASS